MHRKVTLTNKGWPRTVNRKWSTVSLLALNFSKWVTMKRSMVMYLHTYLSNVQYGGMYECLHGYNINGRP